MITSCWQKTLAGVVPFLANYWHAKSFST